MYFKNRILILYSVTLFLFLSLIFSNFTISSAVFAQNTNPISPSLPPTFQTPIPSNQLPPSPSFSDQLSPLQQASSTNKSCILTPSLIEQEGSPQQTEGPYFVSGALNRSNITSDPSDGTVQHGIPLQLEIQVYKINNGVNKTSNNTTTAINNTSTAYSCIPFKGAQVDIWHANPQGLYSGISQIGTEGKMYLRGSQTTDNNGTVKFNTIYPGWYPGRSIHIHVIVRAFNGTNETFHWTSQLYLNNSVNQQVHTQSPYSKHGLPPIKNEQDGIYTGPSTDKLIQSNTGQHLMLHLIKDKRGYTGTFNIVVNSPTMKK